MAAPLISKAARVTIEDAVDLMRMERVLSSWQTLHSPCRAGAEPELNGRVWLIALVKSAPIGA
jgi:hypothetical protein